MTIAVNPQPAETVSALELTDLSVGLSEGTFETCPVLRTAKDVVVTGAFSLASDKKTCLLSQIQFLVGQP